MEWTLFTEDRRVTGTREALAQAGWELNRESYQVRESDSTIWMSNRGLAGQYLDVEWIYD
jgi:hypothetical protein